MSDLLEKINSCAAIDDVYKLIDEAIKKCNTESEAKEMIGFPYGERKCLGLHKGFINSETRIRFSPTTIFSYSMKDIDYFYEFAKFIRDKKITTKNVLVSYLMTFINEYLGFSTVDRREDYFFSNSFGKTASDEEAFKIADNFDIGNLKNKNIGMCTERSAIAQNILSLFGFESYYCIGCVLDNEKEEPHCFNVVRSKDGYCIVDYSLLCSYYLNNVRKYFVPFIGTVTFDNISDFFFNNGEFNFDVYEYDKNENGLQKIKVNERKYVIGKFSFDINKTKI